MMLKKLMDKPLLVIGFLFLGIFLSQLYRKGHFSKRKELLQATSCRAALVKLDRRVPQSWQLQCEQNNLAVQIKEDVSLLRGKEQKDIRQFLYRQLANHLKTIAAYAPTDNLERTFIIRIRLESEKLQIDAVTEGKHLVNLKTLESKQHIQKHLQRTVQVKETPK